MYSKCNIFVKVTLFFEVIRLPIAIKRSSPISQQLNHKAVVMYGKISYLDWAFLVCQNCTFLLAKYSIF